MTPGINRMKTWILIAAMGALFVLVGAWVGGTNGALIALGIGLVFNFSMYWYSDKIAIATTKSKPVTEQEYPALYRIVRELATQHEMPMPKIYVSDMAQPNAFATGRNPQHASVAVTKGILQILDERELRGVLAHELSHVVNRDILIGSVAAAIAMAAVALNPSAAALMGINVRGVVVLAYMLSSVLAGLAGLLVAPVLFAYSTMGVLPGLKAFSVAIIGGLGNPFGILIAGLLLGVVEFIVAIFNSSLRDAITFFLLIVVLAWRPLGLFEKPSNEKV